MTFKKIRFALSVDDGDRVALLPVEVLEIRKYPGGGKSSPCVTQISTIGAAITSGEACSKMNGDGEDVEDTLHVLGEAMGGLPLE